MKKFLAMLFILPFFIFGCDDTDRQQRDTQENIQKEANAQVGLPAIQNFRDMKTLKIILEKRDQANLQTWTYLVAEMSGKLVFLGRSMGYAIPAATQYTNPMKQSRISNVVLPQADPNGLFSPASAEGSWILMLNPKTGSTDVVYIEPRIIVSPFPLSN